MPTQNLSKDETFPSNVLNTQELQLITKLYEMETQTCLMFPPGKRHHCIWRATNNYREAFGMSSYYEAELTIDDPDLGDLVVGYKFTWYPGYPATREEPEEPGGPEDIHIISITNGCKDAANIMCKFSDEFIESIIEDKLYEAADNYMCELHKDDY